jgi:predicted RND superfamily exporter protein
MDRNQIEKFRRHMGAGKTITLKNEDGTEDEFYFKPLGCEFLPDLMKLAVSLEYTHEQKQKIREMKRLVKEGKKTEADLEELYTLYDEENSARIFEGENANLIVNLLNEMVKRSYPELDDETRSAFIMNNFAKLQQVLMELNENLGNQEVDERILKKIEQVRAARRNA